MGKLKSHQVTAEFLTTDNKDVVKLDELGAPTDNTDLNATGSAHGLCPKLSGNTDEALRGDGSWGSVGGGTDPVYLVEDDFNDSEINTDIWTVSTPGSSTAVEGADGVVLTTVGNDDPSLYLYGLPSYMSKRNWVAQVHMTFAFTGSPGNASQGQLRIEGKGGGSTKFFLVGIEGNSGPAYYRKMHDNQGSAVKASIGSSAVWIRIRRFGDEVRMDYYVGSHTVDVDGGRYWIEYDSTKTWYVVPKSGTYYWPIEYETLILRVDQWTGNPGAQVTFRKFKLEIF